VAFIMALSLQDGPTTYHALAAFCTFNPGGVNPDLALAFAHCGALRTAVYFAFSAPRLCAFPFVERCRCGVGCTERPVPLTSTAKAGGAGGPLSAASAAPQPLPKRGSVRSLGADSAVAARLGEVVGGLWAAAGLVHRRHLPHAEQVSG